MPGKRTLKRFVLSAVICGLTAKLSFLAMPETLGSLMPLWPLTGVALTMALLWGPPAIFGVALGILALFAWLAPSSPAPATVLLAGILFAAGAGAQNGIAFIALRKRAEKSSLFARPSDVVHFCGIALVACLVGILVTLPGLFLLGSVYERLPTDIGPHWLSRVVSAIVVTPFLFSSVRGPRPAMGTKGGRLEKGLLYSLVVILAVAVFSEHLPGSFLHQFLMIPLMVWATIRFGERGLTATVLITFSIAAWAIQHGFSTFTEDMGLPIRTGAMLAQCYICFTEIPLLLLAVRESWAKEVELRESHVQIEQRVEERTRELAALTEELRHANAELEQFASLASHDLQEPLRMVTKFLELTRKRSRGKLDAESDEYLGIAKDGAARMDRLVKSMLELARLGTKVPAFRRFESGAVVELALRNLSILIQERAATVHVGELPTLVADPDLLLLVFQNLIGNALKFTRAAGPKIEISASHRDGDWVFSVSDDGIGIEPQHVAGIFTLFHRIPDAKEFPGTGIGLAQCKKIVERHHGRIWVDSIPGRGSTFSFSIPQNLEETELASPPGTPPQRPVTL